ncbi:NAD(P)/FAD-dependent oxidoreductase [Mycobacterium sp. SMC-4]|uniref:NAD(P)/FAD-dependent oxidoreductase n=1 Tax=Mycobacterium sp. SMC-4 TaxID=2857059 RepID=UPI0021B2D4BD|nr:NAD(P)/FAD-dependent oxidoreductase [Mycobacterium sp. SMC-4]UXA16290.1 NAD(P)/FAD-dependent oxidoreductase [Mycobacterium sp. SMC-4]
MEKTWDCVIVGGGAAGLSAALVLGRARRHTLVVDAGAQSNLSAHGIGGLLGFDGVAPAQLYAQGRRELNRYPSVTVGQGEVVGAKPYEGGFSVALADGIRVRARRLLLATGMRYDYPDVPGLQELWGASVFHCPFCHGWEVRDQPLGVLADGEAAVHKAVLVQGWSSDVVLLTNGSPLIDGSARSRLDLAGVRVDERPVARVLAEDGELTAVEFADGSRLPRRGLLVSSTLYQRTPLAAQLGVRFAAPGPVSAEAIEVDPMFQTSVPGVFAAGDVCAQQPQVAAAIAAGSGAAASVVRSLMEETR